MYNTTYYLYSFNTEIYSILFNCMEHVFSEFGIKEYYSSYMEGCLNEYGKIIFENNAIVNTILYFI